MLGRYSKEHMCVLVAPPPIIAPHIVVGKEITSKDYDLQIHSRHSPKLLLLYMYYSVERNKNIFVKIYDDGGRLPALALY